MITGTLTNHSSLPDSVGQFQMVCLAFSKPKKSGHVLPRQAESQHISDSAKCHRFTPLFICVLRVLSSVTILQNHCPVVEGNLPTHHPKGLHELKHHPPCGTMMQGWRDPRYHAQPQRRSGGRTTCISVWWVTTRKADMHGFFF